MRGQHLAITIAETGIGIDQADLPRLFERFYRAKNARYQPGMGLGLSIAKGIIEQHSGTISVESTCGQGSHFIITLPLLNAQHGAFTARSCERKRTFFLFLVWSDRALTQEPR